MCRFDQNNSTKYVELRMIPDLLEKLSSIITYEGNVVVWNESFEKSRNNEMSMMYPEYKPLLDSINDRMLDLSIIFKKDYLH